MDLEPEVRTWLEQLDTAAFATTAFYIDLLATPAGHSPAARPNVTTPDTRTDMTEHDWTALRRGAWRSRARTPPTRPPSAPTNSDGPCEPCASSAAGARTSLARSAGMTQSAVARFEAGGAVPTLPVLERLAHALDADLVVSVTPRTGVA